MDMPNDQSPRKTRSLRTTLLAVALVPSLLLVGTGAVLSARQLVVVLDEHARAERITAVVGRLDDLTESVGDERAISVRSFPDASRPGLAEARQAVDVESAALLVALDEAAPVATVALAQGMQSMRDALATLPQLRRAGDDGQGSRVELARGYSTIQDAAVALIDSAARSSTFADVTEERRNGELLLSAADLLDRSADVTIGALGRGEPSAEERAYAVQEYGGHVAELALLERAVARLDPEETTAFDAVLRLPSREVVAAMEIVLVAPRGPDAPPVALAGYDAAATELGVALHELAHAELNEAAADEAAASASAVRTDVLIAVALVAIGIVVLIMALAVTNGIVRRLTRLRKETERQADHELPALMAQLRSGRGGVEVPEPAVLDHRDDEIGQVARAFEHAQRAAMDAAVVEAKTRRGFNAVFLNIARRSQGVVHSQLRVLDEAERAEIDPDKLDRLFKLDHLATRERRNAENLIILGGGQLGRQWRDPVPAVDVVRSAVSEAVRYNQASLGTMPPVRVLGEAVADVVHLLAELLDNATAFSPPESVIEVRGRVVGRGLVIQIDDPGLGIEADRLEELNVLLATSPEFSLLALSEESQLGLFVVARLAHRHDIRVTLMESAYGGIRAVVLLPETVLAAGAGATPSQPADVAPPRTRADRPAPEPAPTPRAAPATTGGSTGRPTLVPAPTEGRPALPRRRAQGQRPEPSVDVTVPGTGGDVDDLDLTDQVAGQRHSGALGAIQRGTRTGRVEEETWR